MIAWLRVLARGERGQDLMEYALLASLLSLISTLALTALGSYVRNLFLLVRVFVPRG